MRPYTSAAASSKGSDGNNAKNRWSCAWFLAGFALRSAPYRSSAFKMQDKATSPALAVARRRDCRVHTAQVSNASVCIEQIPHAGSFSRCSNWPWACLWNVGSEIVPAVSRTNCCHCSSDMTSSNGSTMTRTSRFALAGPSGIERFNTPLASALDFTSIDGIIPPRLCLIYSTLPRRTGNSKGAGATAKGTGNGEAPLSDRKRGGSPFGGSKVWEGPTEPWWSGVRS